MLSTIISRTATATTTTAARCSFISRNNNKVVAAMLKPTTQLQPHYNLLQYNLQQRGIVTRTLPLMDDELPYHIVMGMPALSPTMESGSLAEWFVKEGDGFVAGDSLAKIETDKASIDFEAQDNGYVAKILVQAQGGVDIKVGKPIMITVEEEEDVDAFKNYIHKEEEEEEATPPAAPAAKEEKASAPEPAATPPPPAVKEAPKAAESTPPPAPPAAAAAAPPSPATATTATSGSGGAWGNLAKTKSPIIKTLRKQQQNYQTMYGRTGQVPL